MARKDEDDLSGFSELLEDSKKFKARKKAPPPDNQDAFELYTFLDQNNIKMEKLNHLYETKLGVLSKCPQDIGLILKQEGLNMKLKEEILGLIQKEKSNFEKHMCEVFDRFFN